MHRVQRRYIMLLEVLIAFALVAFCAIPLIYPHVFILRAEKQFVATVELDHLVNLLFVDTLQKLYQNEIPWSVIESKKPQPIDDTALKPLGYENNLPFTGTYRFIKRKSKISTEKDHSVYWFALTFTFIPKKGAFVKNTQDELSYTYEVIVERKEK